MWLGDLIIQVKVWLHDHTGRGVAAIDRWPDHTGQGVAAIDRWPDRNAKTQICGRITMLVLICCISILHLQVQSSVYLSATP